ncbi:MAG: DUF4199 domain-containing protein [Chitinophagales bacterium]|nr:DUF4199 domain-containing protein [Chitinophagales bacterium]MDW8428552.1 DUF4199 domain-containing protein [Chitinophagales bacterium]
MEKPPTPFLSALKYAFIIGLVSFIWGMIAYLSGWYLRNWANYVSYGILLLGIVLAILDYRNKRLGGNITFGQAFSAGCLFSIFYGLLGVLSLWLMIHFIAPDMIEQILQATEERLIAQGLSDSELKTAMEMTRKFMTPAWMSVFVIGFSLLFGAIFSSLAALFLKRTPPEA